MSEPEPTVREVAYQAFGRLMANVGEQAVKSFFDSLDKIKQQKIRDYAKVPINAQGNLFFCSFSFSFAPFSFFSLLLPILPTQIGPLPALLNLLPFFLN